MEYELCPWCGVRTEKSDGPVHRYLESSPGCWALYGELLSREYQDFEGYFTVHDLTVDAYALQHPGTESAQTISSSIIHLADLYAYFELKKPMNQLVSIKRNMVLKKDSFRWLEPPENMTLITAADALQAKSVEEHVKKVTEWSEYIFKKWEKHHIFVAELLEDS